MSNNQGLWGTDMLQPRTWHQRPKGYPPQPDVSALKEGRPSNCNLCDNLTSTYWYFHFFLSFSTLFLHHSGLQSVFDNPPVRANVLRHHGGPTPPNSKLSTLSLVSIVSRHHLPCRRASFMSCTNLPRWLCALRKALVSFHQILHTAVLYWIWTLRHWVTHKHTKITRLCPNERKDPPCKKHSLCIGVVRAAGGGRALHLPWYPDPEETIILRTWAMHLTRIAIVNCSPFSIAEKGSGQVERCAALWGA